MKALKRRVKVRPKVRVYHVKALLGAYAVWALLNLGFAYACCRTVASSSVPQAPWARVLYSWAWLHLLPLWALVDKSAGAVGAVAVVVLTGSSVAAGLLTKERWAYVLAIAGMSLWFLEAWCLFGLSAK